MTRNHLGVELLVVEGSVHGGDEHREADQEETEHRHELAKVHQQAGEGWWDWAVVRMGAPWRGGMERNAQEQ